MNTVSFLVDGYQVAQDRYFYKQTCGLNRHRHVSETKYTKHQFTSSDSLQKKTHLLELYAEMGQHFTQLNADLLSSTKASGE